MTWETFQPSGKNGIDWIFSEGIRHLQLSPLISSEKIARENSFSLWWKWDFALACWNLKSENKNSLLACATFGLVTSVYFLKVLEYSVYPKSSKWLCKFHWSNQIIQVKFSSIPLMFDLKWLARTQTPPSQWISDFSWSKIHTTLIFFLLIGFR